MVEVDSSAFRSEGGTVAFDIQISSPDSVSIPDTVRVLVNRKEPDQRGEIHPLPGKIRGPAERPLPEPVVRAPPGQEPGSRYSMPTSFEQIAVLRTGNTPTQMTFAYDAQVLWHANDNSRDRDLYDLNALRPMRRIAFPHGHYPRSIAAANGVILAVARNVSDSPCSTTSTSSFPSASNDRPDRSSAFTASPYLAVPQYAPPACLGVWVNNVPLRFPLWWRRRQGNRFYGRCRRTALLYDSSYDTYCPAART